MTTTRHELRTMEATLLAELLEEIRLQRAQTTSELARLRSGIVNDVLSSGLVTLDVNGQYTESFMTPFGSIALTNHGTGTMTVQNGPPMSAPPNKGKGVAKVPAGGYATLNLSATEYTVYGNAGDQATVQVFSKGQPPFAQGAEQVALSLAEFGSSATAGSALNGAIATLPANGGMILVPAGDWTINTSILINKSNIIIQGVGYGSRLLFDGSVVSPAIKMADTTTRRVVIRDLAILQNGASNLGTTIDASYFTQSILSNVLIDAATNKPSLKGIVFNAVGTLYNIVEDCRIAVAGVGSQGLVFDTTSNSNVARNVRIVAGDTNVTGVFVNSTAISLDHVDVETAAAFGIDVGASGHSCTMIEPYTEANAINIRLAAGVESPTIIGGHIASGSTNNIVDNGSSGLRIVNARVAFDPFSYVAGYNNSPIPRWLFPFHGGMTPPATDQIPTAGRVYLNEFEVPEGAVVDAIAFDNSGVVAGNVTAGVYGPITTEETCNARPVIVQSASTAVAGINSAQTVTFTATYLKPGRYYAAVEFSDGATMTSKRHTGVQMFIGAGQHYDRGGGYGALTDPCPAPTENFTTLIAVRVRCVPLTAVS